jgi:hypothetical protein
MWSNVTVMPQRAPSNDRRTPCNPIVTQLSSIGGYRAASTTIRKELATAR